ncbi:MAG: methyltransferase domain-containing protein [Myxococcales bacterium]|nr:methyltransferase domain-containing protein [Myxococcales bacterium]
MSSPDKRSEAGRLEALWGGEFGDAYVDRNREAVNLRGPFWSALLDEFPAKRVLEVGCNLGGNLRWIAEKIPAEEVHGIEINKKALAELRKELPVNALWGHARELPFRDRWFDLTFTMGVLIHQPPEMLPLVMAEIVRCSRRYVLCGEYFAPAPTEVAYRGETGALFKRDFGGDYLRLFPELTLRKQGFLGKAEGWDDVTFWLFEKTA